jgi:hypothetical protein
VLGRRARRSAGVLSVLLASAATDRATGQETAADDAHRRLVGRYRAGDTVAARSVTSAVDSRTPLPRGACQGREECEAAAVLNLAASLLFGGMHGEGARDLIESTLPLVSRQAATFTFDWLLAAGALHQAYADPPVPSGCTPQLELRPGSVGLLARAASSSP